MTFLPLRPVGEHTGRDPMTCLYRCGNACDHPVPNESGNPYFGDVVDAEVSRRGVVRAGAVGALVARLRRRRPAGARPRPRRRPPAPATVRGRPSRRTGAPAGRRADLQADPAEHSSTP